MANDISAIVPVLYSAAQTVAKEPVGCLDAINMNFDDKGVAIGDTVKVPIAPTRSASDFTPTNVAATGSDAVAEQVSVTITNNRVVSWHLTGEQLLSLENGGNDQEWIRQLVEQGMRTLRNEAEVTCADAIYQGGSRAFGAAGTTPFASSLDILADVRKGLRDNGAPMADMQCVCDTSAIANLQKLDVYQQANLSGTDEERRTGSIGRQFGFQIRDSAGIATHTKGTGSGYLSDGIEAVGQTTLTTKTGTGTILAGDVITHASDATNKYVVTTALASNDVVIGKPGLLVATADDDAITVGNNYTPNVCLERSSVVGIMRPPVYPRNETVAQTLVTDQFGLTYLFLDIQQDGQRTWRLHLAWGFKVVNQEFVMVLMG